MNLLRGEVRLREYDKALRLRMSQEKHETILIERKTFRGRYGALAPLGFPWGPDQGRRREEGHVPVASIQVQCFNLQDLKDALVKADTWHRHNRDATPRWQRVEEIEAEQKAQRLLSRRQDLRYRASQVFDKYVWKHKQRVSMYGA